VDWLSVRQLCRLSMTISFENCVVLSRLIYHKAS
jgi:hypothetical protein